MKFIKSFPVSILLFGLLAFSYSSMLMAEALDIEETLNFIEQALELLGGIKGASAYVIAGIVVELLLKFLDTSLFNKLFSSLKGKYKLLVVTALSYISGVLSLVNVGGQSIVEALLHSTSLTALLVLINQVYKQFFQKDD